MSHCKGAPGRQEAKTGAAQNSSIVEIASERSSPQVKAADNQMPSQEKMAEAGVEPEEQRGPAPRSFTSLPGCTRRTGLSGNGTAGPWYLSRWVPGPRPSRGREPQQRLSRA